MSEDGQTPPPDDLLCSRCGSTYDAEDNFCRKCGLSLDDRSLPSVPISHVTPAVWQPTVPALIVRSAAVVAVGTVAEMLVRRIARGAFGRRNRSSSEERKPTEVVAPEDAPPEENEQIVSETFFLRRIRIRR